jgi:hypothetical protein
MDRCNPMQGSQATHSQLAEHATGNPLWGFPFFEFPADDSTNQVLWYGSSSNTVLQSTNEDSCISRRRTLPTFPKERAHCSGESNIGTRLQTPELETREATKSHTLATSTPRAGHSTFVILSVISTRSSLVSRFSASAGESTCQTLPMS